jgi:hypothetical protein
MNRQCRSFGELLHLLEMDILKPLVDVCKDLRYTASADLPDSSRKEKSNCVTGTESEKVIELTAEYEGMVEELVKAVQETPKKSLSIAVDKTILGINDLNSELSTKNKVTHLVVSLPQVKDGIEHVMRLQIR